MSIPESSLYPDAYDSDNNLYLVRDALRIRLAEDYNPGDTRIVVEDADEGVTMAKFPDTGLITLTEQQSDLEDRAISFYYSSKTETSFEGLVLLPEFEDSIKPALITNITQNVMDEHHNALKDALIAIQEFVGVEGTTDTAPGGDTLEGRVNFLKRLIWTPRAWFTMNKRVGLVPLCVTFTDQSFRLGFGCGEGEVIYLWDFGDETHSIIVSVCPSQVSGVSEISAVPVVSVVSEIEPPKRVISVTSTVPVYERNVIVRDMDGGSVQKCYTIPSTYNVSLKVRNQFGEDTVVFSQIIQARIEAPDEAVIDYIPNSSQDLTPGIPSGGPYTTPPVLRSPTDTFIAIEVPQGENPNTPGRSYAGELLDGCGDPIDPIIHYTWDIADDLEHGDSPTAKASFSIGGVYDLVLRVDTSFGAYRITTYEQTLDIIEPQNLWLWNFQSPSIRSYEFGLVSETFKTGGHEIGVFRDDSFLDYLGFLPYAEGAEERAKAEFARNVGFTRVGETNSGDRGLARLFWSGGGADVQNQEIKTREYNGFADTYDVETPIKLQPWNWTALFHPVFEEAYFLFGTQEYSAAPDTNPANPLLTTVSLAGLPKSRRTLTTSDFISGGEVLLEHPSEFHSSGVPTNGYFATYRTTWKSATGYILRNSAVNEYFEIKQFFSTVGLELDPVQQIQRLDDMTGGDSKLEGELVTLSNGVYFFNNSSEILAYNTTTNIWEVGGPSLQSASFRSLQDSSVSGFSLTTNRLLAASDEDSVVYLSYDYSPRAFIKFNSSSLTFDDVGIRPMGEQFVMGIY
ncbi:MAG: hypothetical protein ACXADB_08955 [Candidatus Hermodarchaeia archaeon]|jgi:PKD repeat protein